MVKEKDFGKTYKKIREAKNLTQDKICKKTISRTTLSKFENSNLYPSFQTMQFLLNQINVSFDEFLFINNGYCLEEKDSIKKDFYGLVSNIEHEKLSSIKKRIEQYLEKNEYDQSLDLILSVIVSLMILEKDSTKSPKLHVNKVWDYLSQNDQWSIEDMRLLNCTLFFFSIESVLFLGERLLKTLHKYEGYDHFSSLKVSVLINISTLLLQNQLIDECKEFNELALSNAENSKRYDLIGICLVRKGILNKDSELCSDGIRIFEIFKNPVLKSKLEEEINLFL